MRPIAQFAAAGRTRFVVAIDEAQVVVVDPGRHVSFPLDRSRWWRVNGDHVDDLEDFVGAAGAHAQARAAVAGGHGIECGGVSAVAVTSTFAESLDWAAQLEDGWDDRFVRSVAPSATAIEAARNFVYANRMPDPDVEVNLDGSIDLVFHGDGEVGFTFDSLGEITCLIDHGETVLSSDDLSDPRLVELGVGLVNVWRGTVDADVTARELLLVLVLDQGRGEDYLVDPAMRTVQSAHPTAPDGDAQEILAAHVHDLVSLATPRVRQPGRTEARLARSEEGLLECRLDDLGIELVQVHRIELPQPAQPEHGRHPATDGNHVGRMESA